MRGSAILAVLCLAPMALAADPPTATVTGRNNGKAVTYSGGMGTLVEGIAIATFGTGQFETEVAKDQWETALQNDHILVRFPKPQGLAATIQGGDKTYEVSELLVPTAVSTGGPLARVGDKYLVFGKWDPAMILLLRDRWGIGKPAQK